MLKNWSPRVCPAVLVTTSVVILASLFAIEAMSAGGGYSGNWRPSALFIAVTFALISYLAFKESRAVGTGWIWGGMLIGSVLALLGMTAVFAEFAVTSGQAVTDTVTVANLLTPGSYDSRIFDILNAIEVDPRTFFIMDGLIDIWVYVQSKGGLTVVPYQLMGVQERGIVYLYATVMHVMGGFNSYYMVLTNWLAHLLATTILYAISKRVYGVKAAAIGAGLYLVFPENIYWGGVIYKDEIVVLTVLAGAYSLLQIVQERRHSYYILFVVAIVSMAFLRSGLIWSMVCAGLISHAISGADWLKSLGKYVTVIAVTVVGASLLLPAGVAGDLDQKILRKPYEKLVGGSTAYLDTQSISYRTSKLESMVERIGGGDLNLKKIYFVPIRIGFHLISPFPPTSMRFEGDRYILPSTYLFTILLTFFAVGIYRGVLTMGGTTMMATQFILLGLTIAFAGPFVYERYRLVLTPFFLSIAISVLVTSTWRQRIGMASLSGTIWLIAFAFWTMLR